MARPRPLAVVRPPPPADPIAAFIRGDDPAVQTPPERPRDGTRALVERRNGRQTRRTTVHFKPETFDALQAYCAAEGDDLSRVVDRAVREFLARAKGDG